MLRKKLNRVSQHVVHALVIVETNHEKEAECFNPCT